MLHISSVEKFYNDQIIFTDLDLIVEQGKFKVILGPSGCGKTTLFDVLTGVVPLDKGHLSWNNEALPDLAKHTAYMQQKDMLLSWFSLLDNALLPARTTAQDTATSKAQACYLFKRLGLEGYESHMPNQVSGGMRQRCSLARTLMFNRDLILLDEPLSALDYITRRKLQSFLLLLQTEFKKTIFMITHDIEEALLLADEIYLLSPIPMTISRHFVLNQPKPRKFNDPELLTIKTDVLNWLEGEVSNEGS
jgi:putative hydroxymethylpyrimidine transport system ATP-binding protein